jgi:serine/threonine protein kinase
MSPEERPAWLESLRRENPSLAKDLQSLLKEDDVLGREGFLKTEVDERLVELRGAAALLMPTTLPSPERANGARVGNYKLLKEIGRGGMGVVYLAVRADDSFYKRVAVKLVKRGMDSDAILQRFRRERQILAALDHPNIARLLDGGTTEDGLPYFVMEYIEGQTLLSYCDGQKLPIRRRLELLLEVCSAVHYAHQNSIVHRDLKPSNLLVTAKGSVKLLDFGIAKFLNPELLGQPGDATATAVRAMTPEYASPEQIRGEPVTASTDIYSLGVILYELLTGRRPYRLRKQSSEDMARAICDQEPDKPSVAISRTEPNGRGHGENTEDIIPQRLGELRGTDIKKLRRVLSGDLDSIVLKTMRKEPQARYATAQQLSEDIRAHLERRRVLARKGTLTYFTANFVKRHRGALTWSALVLTVAAIALLAGIKLSSNRQSSPEQLIGAAIKALSDSKYEVPRSELEKILANLNEVAMHARILPAFKDGKAEGFKLFSIRPDSLYHKIGIQNGDVIKRINGEDINSPNKALEIFSKLRDSNRIDIEIDRHGTALLQKIYIVKPKEPAER